MKPHINKGLFSNYYLDELLPREEEFNIPFSSVGKVQDEIKRIWDKAYLSSLSEPQIRKHFLDKVFEILGWTIDVEPPTPSGEWSKHPDYALFHTSEDLKMAQKATKEDYFNKALCIGEAKRWGRPLDRKVKGEKDPFEVQNPSLQISRYLWLTGVRWGILTDGKYWRVFERETARRLDVFYEIDLEDLIENGSTEDFKYFYLFFRRDAFPDFLEKVYKESVDYAEAVGEELKENVYHALKALTQGFLSTPANKLKDTQLREIHDNSLILLYRLLFILYAEYRGLLPIGENRFYTESYSLDALKKKIAGRLDKAEPIATSTYGYWNKLKELFEIINIGNSELGVPPYNGGLFDREKYDFLEKHRIGDLYIAKAVDLVSRSSDRAYIDYGSLEIRHLGSIYEGLLEYKLKIADEDIVPIKEKGKVVFIPVEKAAKQKKKIKEEEIVGDGEVYLVTDKGERKATGSYYTPDYIVKYIIENTLGPLTGRIRRETEWAQEIKNTNRNLNEIFEEIIKENGEEDKENLTILWELTRSNQERRDFLLNMLDGAQPAHAYDPIERILQLKVLDPAMGSGHFLVEATDFLARELLKVLSGEPLVRSAEQMQVKEAQEPYGKTEPEEEDIRWARREVVERCIFGVDLNPLAVELAKLSLWLYTVSKDRPLNFLDHHLRCGNSLIGANITDLARFPELKKKKAKKGPVQIGLFESVFREKVSILLKSFELIETHPSDTVEQIREKERLYQDFRKELSRFQDVADVWTSIYFGNEVDFGTYQRLQGELRSSDEEWERLNQKPWFRKAKDIAKEKNFFHWNLEFPEVFEGDQKKEKPGFDAVVGNPPYGAVFDLNEKPWLKTHFTTSSYNLDSFSFFVEKFAQLVPCLHFGMIIPNTWCSIDDGLSLRRLLLEHKTIDSIVDTGNVFESAEITTMLLLFRNKLPSKNHAIAIRRVSYESALETRLDEIKSERWSSSFAVTQTEFLAHPKAILNFFVNPNERKIISHIKSKSISLGTISDLSRGARPYGLNEGNPPQSKALIRDRAFTGFKKLDNTWRPLFTATCVGRYEIDWHGMWIKYGPWLAVQGEDRFFFSKRLLLQRIVSKTPLRFLASYCQEPFINNTDILNLVCSQQDYSLLFLGAIINSALLPWFVAKENVNLLREAYPKINVNNLAAIPICCISFVTPLKKRKKQTDEVKTMCRLYLDTNNPDTIFHFVKSILVKKYRPDAELVKKHNSDPINKNCQIKEDDLCDQSDVVHDILAFLAERMIEINKDKQKETSGFLEWLESQLKIQPDKKGNVGIETLTGKTQIKNYLGDYQKGEEHLSFEDFWKIIEKNKNRIEANLKSREIFESVKTEYENSLSRLLPIKEKLKKTDWLIDQIVYKLYGLTEEEINLVEDSP
jgi:type I restriction-modification system DNA methylase subunit